MEVVTIAITVEELEILVETNVEKVMPQIQKMIKEVTGALKNSNIDFSAISQSINKEVDKARPTIQKLKKEFNPEEVNFTIGGKKEISGISEEFRKLKGTSEQMGNAFDLSRYRQELKSVENQAEQTKEKIKEIQPSSVSFAKYDTKAIQQQIDGLNSKTKDTEKSATGLSNKFKKIVSEASKIASATAKVTKNIVNGAIKAGKMALSFLGIKKNADNLKNSIKQGVKQVLKYATALIGIRSIYNGLKSIASEWLSSNDKVAKQLSANLNYMKMAIGSSLAPVISYIINLIYQAVKAVQSLIHAFTGVNIFAKMTANNYKSIAGSAKSAKKETKQLAGIHDEINNIQKQDSDGGGAGGVTPNIDLSQVDTKLSDWFKTALEDAYTFGYEVGQKINEGLEQIPWEQIKSTTRNIANKTTQFLNGAIEGTDWNLVGKTIGEGLNTGIGIAYEFFKEFDFKKFGNSISQMIISAIKTTDFKMLAETLSEKLKGKLDFLTGIIEEWDWKVIVEAIIRFIQGIDVSGISESFFTLLGSAVASLLNLAMIIGDYIGQAIDNAKQYFQDKIEECGGNVVLGILKGISDAIVGIGLWISEHIFKPFIEGFKNVFGIHSPSTVMAELGTFIIQGLFNGISSLIDKIKEIWNNLKEKTVEIITNIKDKVIEKVIELKDKAIEKITTFKDNMINKFNEAKDKVIEKVTNIKTKALEIFENIKTSISTKIAKVKETIVDGFEKAVDYIKSLPGQALTWGKDLIDNMVRGIEGAIGKVKEAVGKVANAIKGFLGFSEPEEGPLSNFHTYMPDMIDLMKKGIKDNMGSLMSTIDSMAKEMSYTLNVGMIPEYAVATPNLGSFSNNQFRDVENDFSSNNNISFNPRISVAVGDEELVDKTIDGINEKTYRLGKNVIKVVNE